MFVNNFVVVTFTSCGPHFPCPYCHHVPGGSGINYDSPGVPVCPSCGKERLRKSDLDRYIAALETIDHSIAAEHHCPHIGGIKVKPTYFYVFVGYAVSAAFALVAKAIANK